MRTKLTAALSLAGVLVAGSAAALVNTQILQSADAGTSLPATAAPADTNVTETTAPVVVDGTVAAADTASQAAYQIGDAGTVVLDSANGVLSIVSAAPSPGWLVVAAEQPDGTHVEVRLQSNTTVVTFRANLVFGVVSTSVERGVAGQAGTLPAGSLPATSPGSTPPGGSTTGTTGSTGGTPTTAVTGSTSGPGTTVDDDDEDDDDDHEDDDEEEEEDD